MWTSAWTTTEAATRTLGVLIYLEVIHVHVIRVMLAMEF